ncbi:MAG: hypothetical protein L0196_02395 [candidate division Zixibacteria bacterium]|nr:hypothetical protein [candidate division Zixibacteria bacterium]
MKTGIQNQIAKLASLRFVDYPVTSIFLSLRPSGTRRPGLVFLKKELARLEKSFPPRSAEAADLAGDRRRTERAVEEAQARKANQLAIFSSARQEFFEPFFWTLAPESDEGIPNSVVRGFRPYLHPLALLADRLESFLLLVADQRKGELFKVEAGRITENWRKEAVWHPEARRKKGGGYDRRTGNIHTTFTRRVEGHLQMHEEKYFRSLAEKAGAWARASGIRSIIVGADAVSGPPIREEIARLNSHFSTLSAPIDAKLSTVKKLALGVEAFRKWEDEISFQRVAELFSPGHRQAVFGATEALARLRTTPRAELLILDEAFHREGLLCGSCSAPAAQEASCPLCGGPVKWAPLENELVCLAAALEIEIEFVKDSEPLARKGGVGLLV